MAGFWTFIAFADIQLTTFLWLPWSASRAHRSTLRCISIAVLPLLAARSASIHNEHEILIDFGTLGVCRNIQRQVPICTTCTCVLDHEFLRELWEIYHRPDLLVLDNETSRRLGWAKCWKWTCTASHTFWWISHDQNLFAGEHKNPVIESTIATYGILILLTGGARGSLTLRKNVAHIHSIQIYDSSIILGKWYFWISIFVFARLIFFIATSSSLLVVLLINCLLSELNLLLAIQMSLQRQSIWCTILSIQYFLHKGFS